MRIFLITASVLIVTASFGVANAKEYKIKGSNGCHVWVEASIIPTHPDTVSQWNGLCRDGLAEGEGKWTYGNTNYVGPMKAGRPHGDGVLNVFNGRDFEARYEGSFRRGTLNGQGKQTTYIYISMAGNFKDEFEGSMVNSELNGYGTISRSKKMSDGTYRLVLRYEGVHEDMWPNGNGATSWYLQNTDISSGYTCEGVFNGSAFAIVGNGAAASFGEAAPIRSTCYQRKPGIPEIIFERTDGQSFLCGPEGFCVMW